MTSISSQLLHLGPGGPGSAASSGGKPGPKGLLQIEKSPLISIVDGLAKGAFLGVKPLAAPIAYKRSRGLGKGENSLPKSDPLLHGPALQIYKPGYVSLFLIGVRTDKGRTTLDQGFIDRRSIPKVYCTHQALKTICTDRADLHVEAVHELKGLLSGLLGKVLPRLIIPAQLRSVDSHQPHRLPGIKDYGIPIHDPADPGCYLFSLNTPGEYAHGHENQSDSKETSGHGDA